MNALGALCLGITDAYRPVPIEARPALRVLPDFEIVGLGNELTHADRLALERFAERTADRVWRLRSDRLTAAIAGERASNRIPRVPDRS